MQITVSDAKFDFLLDERVKEFAGGQLHCSDLKRTGNFVERVQKYNPEAGIYIKYFHILHSSPQKQIDAVVNKGELVKTVITYVIAAV